MEKPNELIGIRFKDFTPEQRKLYGRWQWAKHGHMEVFRRKTNPEVKKARRAYIQRYKAERKATDPRFALTENLRSKLSAAVKSQSGSVSDLIGCSMEFFRSYLATCFKAGMSWETYGKVWHLDHKRPVATFDLLDPIQLRECFHYTNMRPRFASLNEGDTRVVR